MMKVVKRSGVLEDVKFDQITERLKMLSKGLSIDPIKIARTVCAQIKDHITTRELDELSANICAALSIQEPEYDVLGVRILMSSHDKDTCQNYVDVVRKLQENKDVLGDPSPILDLKFADFILSNEERVRRHFDECYETIPMYQMSLFGWKTLHRSYLLQSNRTVVERPQHLFYRVALFLHYPDLDRTRETYRHMVQGHFIHATPTLYHAGTHRAQMSSCYLLGTEDNVDGIYKTISDVAKISKWAGGIGVNISSIRSKNSYIRGTNGFSNGIMPMLRVYNDTSRYIDQCVDGSTHVYTKDGVKCIYEVQPKKDYVLQRTGYYELLEKKLEHPYEGQRLTIAMDDGTVFHITPEHPLFGRHSKLYDVDETPYWIDAEDLQIGDQLAFPVPKHTEDVYDEFSEMTMFCWGMLLGWGHISVNNVFASISFPIQAPKKLVDTFYLYLSTNMIHYQTHLDSERIVIKFKRTNLFPIKFDHLYPFMNVDKKHIHPSVVHLPLQKLKMFVRGLLYTQATLYGSECFLDLYSYAEEEKTFSTLLYIMSRLSISIERRDDGFVYMGFEQLTRQGILEPEYYSSYVNTKTKHDDLVIHTEQPSSLPRNVNTSTSTSSRDFMYKCIKTITRQNYSGLLYDLEFQHEHSYVIPSSVLHNGGGKRKGSFAMYIEPWHADIMDFIMAKRNVGNEDERARDLFYGLWIPDLFMKRVEKNEMWSLMCPNISVGLEDVYGDAFDSLYTTYEKDGRYVRQIPARDLWKEILQSQIETGIPYMLYKDSCNHKSNQKNLGTIHNSNLCTEIIQFSSKNEYAVCNLASINLSNCIEKKQKVWTQDLVIYSKDTCRYCKLLKQKLERLGMSYQEIEVEKEQEKFHEKMIELGCGLGPYTVPKVCVPGEDGQVYGYTDFYETYLRPSFDYQELARRVAVLVVNMNQIIDKNYYPTHETEVSNKRHRPIGIGVQGLADLFCEMGMAFDSDDAKFLHKKIFETIYFTALSTSNRIAKDIGKTYDSYDGCPLSQGIFHYELCHNFEKEILVTDPIYDWKSLRHDILTDGVRNSLFVAPMPTASTSQILYQNECFEPFTSNLYVRRTLAGEFTIFNKYMVQDLRDMGLWNQETIDHLIVHKGSIQNLMEVPKSIRLIYRTAWEISQKSLIDMAVHRQWFIDQSQSFNLFMSDPSLDKLTKMHFYGWKNGLKTGSYYIRTKPQHFSQNFTVDPKKEDEICTSCSA